MIHGEDENTSLQVHLEYVEMTNVGQAYRMSRHPVNFDMNGDMTGSYVRGCSIHTSFNRAIAVQGTNNLLVEDNVAYDIQAHAFFIGNGGEVGNTFEHNLAVSVKSSSGGLNSDFIPAAFLASSMGNTLTNNHAVGGEWHGFWFTLPEHPTGPSFDESICLQNVPLGEFSGNTAHSNGGHGLWTFQRYTPQKDGNTPRTDGNCKQSIQNSIAAQFSDQRAWNNFVGVEFVDGSGLQCVNSILAQNSFANFRGVTSFGGPKISYSFPTRKKRGSSPPESLGDVFYGLDNSVIVGRTNSDALWQLNQGVNGVTEIGAVIPFGHSVAMQHTAFTNFYQSNTYAMQWTEIRGNYLAYSGYPLWVLGLTFDNVLKTGIFRWMHEAIVYDVDNSLKCSLGDSPAKILPSLPILPPGTCPTCSSFDDALMEAITCPYTMRFHQVVFDVAHPSYLDGKNAVFLSENRSMTGIYSTKREGVFSQGYSATLPDGYTITLQFEDAEDIQNISMRAVFYDFKVNVFFYSCNLYITITI